MRKLCDVWFDEIKPHLIRNKIKLHVHEDDADEEERKKLPQGVPECSHLDPGDSDVRACLLHLIFNNLFLKTISNLLLNVPELAKKNERISLNKNI